ncbi:GGDEF domain-containing protein [bacterium]|nr:GGDEF domain-containing protein [bacterium]
MVINPSVFSAYNSAGGSADSQISEINERIRLSTLTSYLVNFTTIELEPAHVHDFPDKICDFLITDVLDYSSVAFLSFDNESGMWVPLSSRGKPQVKTESIPLFEGSMVLEEEYAYYSFFNILDVSYLIIVSREGKDCPFSQYGYSFLSLFSTLISSFFHMKLLAKDVEEHLVEMSTIRTSAVIFSGLKEGRLTLEEAFYELNAALSFKGMVLGIYDESEQDEKNRMRVTVKQGVKGNSWSDIFVRVFTKDELFSQDWMLYPLTYEKTIFGAVLCRFSENNPTLSAVQKKVMEYTIPQITTVLTNKKFHMEAMTDALTSIWNRRYILNALEERASQLLLNPTQSLSVAMVDIDDFKVVNDTYGHPMGDEVLRKVTEVLNKSLRGSDIVGRYGGEEFLVLMQANSRAAKVICQRMLKGVRSLKFFANGTKQQFSLTISIGYATYNRKECGGMDCLIADADQALYSAKKLGKDRVEIALSHSEV